MTRLLLIPSALEVDRLMPGARDLPPGAELLACGVGLLRAGLLTAERLARGDVRDVLLVGVAGTRDPALAPVGTLVVGSAVRNEAIGAGHGASFLSLGEMRLQRELIDQDLLPLAALPIPAAVVCSTATDVAPSTANGHANRAVHGAVQGVLGSVAAASASAADAAAWRARHPEVLAEDMESWAVAVACARAGVPLACVRAISNVAGQRDMAAWDLDGASAALLAVLPALLASPPLFPPGLPR